MHLLENRAVLLLTLLLPVVYAGGCSRGNCFVAAPGGDESRARFGAAPNCGTARDDLRLLESEKSTIRQRSIAGLRTVVPISLVGEMVGPGYARGIPVPSDQYNSDLNAKIAELSQICGIDG